MPMPKSQQSWVRSQHPVDTVESEGRPQVADPFPLLLRVAKTGRNHLNEEFTPLLPTGIGERF